MSACDDLFGNYLIRPAVTPAGGRLEDMTTDDLNRLFKKYDVSEFTFEGPCHDCGKDWTVIVREGDPVVVEGGAVYKPHTTEDFYIKCPDCFQKNPHLSNFQQCEVYSRVVGYLRPITHWNEGKQAEWRNRKMMKPD